MNSTNFWVNLIQRLFTSNPKFFKWIQWVSLAVAAITGLPDFLAFLGINLTGNWLIFENKSLAIAAFVAAIIARLPNKDINQK